MLRVRLLCSIAACFFVFFASAQVKAVHAFWKDDTLLRHRYGDASWKKKDQYIAAAGRDYAKDYKDIYETQFREIGELWKSSRPVTAPVANDYLQSVVSKIVAANPQLRGTDARVVFTRDSWPNAASMGEGTIVVNAGLMVYLDNEAELVFVLCHELAHYYLDHSNQSIKKTVEEINSEAFKNEIKRLSKEEYKVGQQLEVLLKKMAFGSRRHSRDHEAEADRQAWLFMKNTDYDCNGIRTCLELLKAVDDSSVYQAFVPEQSFNFEDYPFRKKWIQKTSAIFSQMSSEDSPLTPQEKDSLRTHPDCDMRIRLLEDSLKKSTGRQKFIVNESLFHQLKKDFFAEMCEQEFRNGNLTRNLYYSLQLLQAGEEMPLAVYSIARDLNLFFERQRDHKLGNIDKESRAYPADYNLLLRMLDRLRLEELASINYYFCRKYTAEMAGYADFETEMKKAIEKKIEFDGK